MLRAAGGRAPPRGPRAPREPRRSHSPADGRPRGEACSPPGHCRSLSLSCESLLHPLAVLSDGLAREGEWTGHAACPADVAENAPDHDETASDEQGGQPAGHDGGQGKDERDQKYV